MSIIEPKPEHQVLYSDLVALLSKYSDKMSGAEMLAVAANMLGKMVAFQDQRTMTPQQAMEIVANNITIGNQQALAEILGPAAGNG